MTYMVLKFERLIFRNKEELEECVGELADTVMENTDWYQRRDLLLESFYEDADECLLVDLPKYIKKGYRFWREE